MEHTLQIAAVLWLLDRVRAVDEDDARPRQAARPRWPPPAALATAARYESLFLFAARRRRPRPATGAAARRWLAAGGGPGAARGLRSDLASRTAGRRCRTRSSSSARRSRGRGWPGCSIASAAMRVRTLAEAPHLLVLLAAVLVLAALVPRLAAGAPLGRDVRGGDAAPPPARGRRDGSSATRPTWSRSGSCSSRATWPTRTPAAAAPPRRARGARAGRGWWPRRRC